MQCDILMGARAQRPRMLVDKRAGRLVCKGRALGATASTRKLDYT